MNDIQQLGLIAKQRHGELVEEARLARMVRDAGDAGPARRLSARALHHLADRLDPAQAPARRARHV